MLFFPLGFMMREHCFLSKFLINLFNMGNPASKNIVDDESLNGFKRINGGSNRRKRGIILGSNGATKQSVVASYKPCRFGWG